jgi:hypothetical protein
MLGKNTQTEGHGKRVRKRAEIAGGVWFLEDAYRSGNV